MWFAREDRTVTRYYMPGPLGEEGRKAGGPEGQRAEKPEGQKARGPEGQKTGGAVLLRSSGLPDLRTSGPPDLRPSGLPVLRPFLSRHLGGLRSGAEQEWGVRNGLTPGIPFSHNLNHVFPGELHATHPQFFPLVDGKRHRPAKGAYNWNPDLGRADVAAYAANAARAYFAQHPDAVSFALGVNDGLIFGESPETLEHVLPPRWFRGRPDYTDLVYTFMNRAAEDLGRTHPDKYLGALAYYWAENAPSIPVHPRVIPFLTADRAQSYDPAFKAEEFELQKRWARAVGLHPTAFEIGDLRFEIPDPSQISNLKSQIPSRSRLGLYDYLDGYGFLIPRVPVRAFAEHIRHARSVGFTDYYGESPLNWGVTGPLHWVIAQVLSQPDADVEALLDEYYGEYFREAAGPMRRFFERCEEIWMQQPGPSYWLKYYRSEAQADLFPSPVCRELRGYLDDAARAARSSRVRDRVTFVSDAFGLTERYVAFQEARVRVSQWVVAAEARPEGQRAGGPEGQRAGGPEGRKARGPEDQRAGGPEGRRAGGPEGRRAGGPGAQRAGGPEGQKAGGPGGNAETLKAEMLKPDPDAAGAAPISDFKSQILALPKCLDEGGSNSEAPGLSQISNLKFEIPPQADLSAYLARRAEFIRYALELRTTQPLAFYPLNHDDWLRNDPTFAAARRLVREHPDQALEALRPLAHYPAVAAALSMGTGSRFTERLTSGHLGGPLRPGQRIAGLQFGIDLPAPWNSRVEPTEKGVHEVVDAAEGQRAGSPEGQRARGPEGRRAGGPEGQRARGPEGQEARGPGGNAEKLKAEKLKSDPGAAGSGPISNLKSQILAPPSPPVLRPSGPPALRSSAPPASRILRISGAENSTVFQWLPAKPGRLYVASVQARGRVSSTNATMITLGWLDANQRPIGKPIVMRMPDTDRGAEGQRARGPEGRKARGPEGQEGQEGQEGRKARGPEGQRAGGPEGQEAGGPEGRATEKAEKLKTEMLKSDAGAPGSGPISNFKSQIPALPKRSGEGGSNSDALRSSPISNLKSQISNSEAPGAAGSAWMTLEQAQRAPANAAWVGIGLRIQHQLPDDWGEFTGFSLLEVEAEGR